jgi:glucosamine--fructose-6-phosphate aminotransferase (isomerizing)
MLGITNRPESSLSRLVPHIIDTQAGIEIGVAATKTFTAQVMAFLLPGAGSGLSARTLAPERHGEIIEGSAAAPRPRLSRCLESQERYIEELAHDFSETQDFIYLGRGINFPIALEGALKLKEISYIHAEGYPPGRNEARPHCPAGCQGASGGHRYAR